MYFILFIIGSVTNALRISKLITEQNSLSIMSVHMSNYFRHINARLECAELPSTISVIHATGDTIRWKALEAWSIFQWKMTTSFFFLFLQRIFCEFVCIVELVINVEYLYVILIRGMNEGGQWKIFEQFLWIFHDL